MSWTIWKTLCFLQSVTLLIERGSSIPHPDFESGWLPIINGLEHVARLNVDHGLGEIPVLVDVSVKVKDNIFPASGFRPDHPVERSGPVVYIYDNEFVNVSTSPTQVPLYRIIPKVPIRFYRGKGDVDFDGDALVRVRAWKQSKLPAADFHHSGIQLKANTSKASDSYAEMDHNLNEIPCLVVVRMKMQHEGDIIMADGVGSSMQVFADVPDRTNAYLVYGYSSTTFRLWVDSSRYGAIFDGRKHTWFDFVISEGKAEIFAWSCSALTPVYNKGVGLHDSFADMIHVSIPHNLEHALVRVTIVAYRGANEGFRFPGAMHLGYPAPAEAGNSVQPVSVGGVSYGYGKRLYYLDPELHFWVPRYSMKSAVFIADSFGGGTNSGYSNSFSAYVQGWLFEENTTCIEPVIPHGFVNTSVNGMSVGTKAKVHCNNGYSLKPKDSYYPDGITCHNFGYWENIPRCVPKAKELDAICNPAEGKCRDQHSACVVDSPNNVYKCLCHEGFRNVDGLCKAVGKFLPKPDYDSEWKLIQMVTRENRSSSQNWFHEFEHGLGTVPILVDVQVVCAYYTFQAIGFRPDQKPQSESAAVVYVYDEKFINISSFTTRSNNDLVSDYDYKMWNGDGFWSPDSNGQVRARAWKAKSLPNPDIEDTTHVLRANTSQASDSFYELKHTLNEYPGIVVVRAKMQHNGRTFYANGVGSALNVFYNNPEMTNAFLVYGYSKNSVRTWVDASENGAIFDGRKFTKFDFVINDATVEIYAWKFSTITPFYTYKFALDDDKFRSPLYSSVVFKMQDALNVAVAEITDPTANNTGFRFQSSAFLADRKKKYRDTEDGNADCVFGGFTYAYRKTESWGRDTEVEMRMGLFKPQEVDYKDSFTGSLVCIPHTFGNGEYSDAVFNGVGIVHSWFPADCGPPPAVGHGYINTTVNGTEVGAFATLECDDGYRRSRNEPEYMPRCGMNVPHYYGIADGIKWIVDISCQAVECDTVEAPGNGTMKATGESFGYEVTFECDDGYSIHGAEKVECLSSGQWSADTPFCKVVDTTSDGHRNSNNVLGIVMSFAIAIYSFAVMILSLL